MVSMETLKFVVNYQNRNSSEWYQNVDICKTIRNSHAMTCGNQNEKAEGNGLKKRFWDF